MDLFPGEPFTVLISSFGHLAVHVTKHTIVGLVLPSPTHILKLGVSASGEADAKEGGGNKNNYSTRYGGMCATRTNRYGGRQN